MNPGHPKGNLGQGQAGGGVADTPPRGVANPELKWFSKDIGKMRQLAEEISNIHCKMNPGHLVQFWAKGVAGGWAGTPLGVWPFNIPGRHLGFSNSAAVKFDQIRHFLNNFVKIISFLVKKSTTLVGSGRATQLNDRRDPPQL